MQCRSCGTVLQPGIVACPVCGTPVSSDDNSDFSLYASSDEAIPYVPYVSSVETSSELFRQETQSGTPTYSDPQFYEEAQSFSSKISQPLLDSVQPSLLTSQQHSAFSAPMKALLISLVLLIVAGGGIIYYALAIRPAQNAAQTTKGTQTISTTQPVVNKQNATPITTTDPQALYNQVTSGVPVLNDPLNTQSTNGWQAPDGMTCTLKNGTMQITASSEGAICMATSTSFNNFAYQAQATITQGNATGLVFRIDVINHAAYIFAIDSNGAYILEAAQLDNLSQANVKILAGATSSAINILPGKPNLLTVIARGSTIYLYDNKQFLTSISDNTASFGSIGVFAYNSQKGPVDESFKAIQVWTL